MGRENKILGIVGEVIAADFLKQKGYKILENNYTTPFGEVDIIAKDGDFTVFVEVKTRATDSLGPPSLSITWAKEKNIIKNALCYLKKYGLVYSYWRIDVVSVKLGEGNGVEQIELIRNAIEGTL
ncbi:MAG: YraN family protein [Candidatus Omnitrophota bacterium]|jgi:putative endonuclease